MTNLDGIETFKDVDSEEKHDIFLNISKCLNICKICPITTQVGSSYCTMEERENLCGGCNNYKEIRKLASLLPDYDLTKRQRLLLNKTYRTITASELEELFYSGVPKAVISRAMGFPQRSMSRFERFVTHLGANIPRGYKPTPAEIQKYQTMHLKED